MRDHDHATGFARGRICEPCNGRLGLLERHPESFYLRKKPGRKAWRRWVKENAEHIAAYLSQPPSGVFHSERKFQACEQGRDAVRDHQIPGQGLATTPSGAGESRANTRSNSQPKAGGPCSQERVEWAREMIRRAREGWPEASRPAMESSEGRSVFCSGGKLFSSGLESRKAGSVG